MHLTVLLPSHVLLDADVTKIVAEAPGGSFCLLPRHADFVSQLTPGLLAVTTAAGQEEFLALADGMLVKQGETVLISTVNGVRGPELGQLQATIRQEFLTLDERERRARSALARLEADFVRRFMALQDTG